MTKRLSRRGFARLGLGAVAAAFGCTPQPKTQPRPAEKPFTVRLGLQSYSLRAFGFDDAVKKAQALGLHFLEAFPAHLPQNLKPEELRRHQGQWLRGMRDREKRGGDARPLRLRQEGGHRGHLRRSRP